MIYTQEIVEKLDETITAIEKAKKIFAESVEISRSLSEAVGSHGKILGVCLGYMVSIVTFAKAMGMGEKTLEEIFDMAKKSADEFIREECEKHGGHEEG